VERDEADIEKECVQMIRDRIGPVAAYKHTAVVKRLPKTRSGKVLRGTIQKIADNREYRIPATIDDPEILNEMEASLSQLGYARSRQS
jgi:propionyl-CoA synthetase